MDDYLNKLMEIGDFLEIQARFVPTTDFSMKTINFV